LACSIQRDGYFGGTWSPIGPRHNRYVQRYHRRHGPNFYAYSTPRCYEPDCYWGPGYYYGPGISFAWPSSPTHMGESSALSGTEGADAYLNSAK
jgi:hypothetical protein